MRTANGRHRPYKFLQIVLFLCVSFVLVGATASRLSLEDVPKETSRAPAQEAPAQEAPAQEAPAQEAPAQEASAQKLRLLPESRRGRAIIRRDKYDYAPTVIKGGKYRMWWCGGVNGDHILHAEAEDLDGPWRARGSRTKGYQIVFKPTFDRRDFDGRHTCDPSVVRANGIYYMYYGGLATGNLRPNVAGAIGVAASKDGITWRRLNGGEPIVEPRGDARRSPNGYGAGQPSVVFVDGYFYLAYTDTTGIASTPTYGGGQYVLRSKDPTFRSGAQELTARGFVDRPTGAHTTRHILLKSFGIDWVYVDALDSFLVARNGIPGRTQLILFDRDLRTVKAALAMPGRWREGPGIVARPDKHALPDANDKTDRALPLDVFRAVGPKDVSGWDLAYVGYDLEAVGPKAPRVGP